MAKSAQSLQRRLTLDVAFKGLVYGLCALIFLPLVAIICYVILKGITVMDWAFFTSLPKPVGESGGGVANAIIGSVLLVALAAIIAIPVGMAIGIYLGETKAGLWREWVQISVETLQGIPSIVFGLLAYLWVVVPLGGFSLISGSVALALMMIPVVAKSTEETVKLIPETLKEAAYALGAPYYKTMITVVIPSAFSGILSGILLSIARISGETAPLLFTAFGNPFMSVALHKPVSALPLLIYNYAMSPYYDWQALAWGSSLLLIGFVLVMSLVAKGVSRR